MIEYPVGKEVRVNLLPTASITGAKGFARVIRAADGTKIFFDVNGVPSTMSSFYAYAVSPNGTPTLLGPITVTDGIATAEFSTPMNQFMLVLSPTEGLTGVTTSNVIFTSEIPSGFAVIPRVAVDAPVSLVASSTMTSYEVPLLNVSSFGKDSKTAKLSFKSGELKGLDAKAHIHKHDDGTTIRVEFDDLNKVSPTKRFVLWAYTPDGQYTRLGQIYNFKKRDEAKIEARTSLKDFGLLMTVEDAEVTVPTGRIWSVFTIS